MLIREVYEKYGDSNHKTESGDRAATLLESRRVR
jgi:hypothetical protein